MIYSQNDISDFEFTYDDQKSQTNTGIKSLFKIFPKLNI